jgi:hypothetical protein
MQHLSEVTVEFVTFTTPGTGLVSCAKRYIPNYSLSTLGKDGITLLFAHCVGGC